MRITQSTSRSFSYFHSLSLRRPYGHTFFQRSRMNDLECLPFRFFWRVSMMTTAMRMTTRTSLPNPYATFIISSLLRWPSSSYSFFVWLLVFIQNCCLDGLDQAGRSELCPA